MEQTALKTELTDQEITEMLDRVKTADAFAASPDTEGRGVRTCIMPNTSTKAVPTAETAEGVAA